MNGKLRCVSCRGYYPRNAEGSTMVGLSGVCSSGCLDDLKAARRRSAPRPEEVKDRARRKHTRRAVHRENKHKYGRRLPGQTRDKIRDRDGYNCRFCGVGQDIQIHHIKYRSQGGGDTLINLISLCETHHMLMHSSKRKWQPILQMVQYLHYAEELKFTVPEVERVFGPIFEAELGEYDEEEAME